MTADPSQQPIRILMIDRASACADYRSYLERAGTPALSFELVSADPQTEIELLIGQALTEGRPYGLAFVALPLSLGGEDHDFLRRMWAADGRLQIVLLAAQDEPELPGWSAAAGHSDDLIVLRRPATAAEVGQMARALARKWLLASEVAGRAAEFDEAIRVRTLEVERAQQGFAEVFNASPLAQSILALDRFEVIAVNTAYEKILGFSVKDLKKVTPETFGRGLDPNRWRSLMVKLAANEAVDDHPFVYEPSPGVRRDMRCSARALTVLGRPCSIWVIRDVTDEIRLEEQFRQSQKMDAIGQLAASIAHDFNNVLTAIQVFTEQAIADSQEQAIRDLLQPVLGSTRRAAVLTRQLLVFSHKQAVQVRPLEIAGLVRDLNPVLRRLLPATIELTLDLPETLPEVLADSANIEQIILNLVINARDALPPKGGSIRIAAGLREFTPEEAPGEGARRSGRFVTLQVADNGSGIPPEVLPRIFEPFYTTKGVGRGTGLGLSTVYSIARQHRGWVEVETAVGSGTTFTVFQPVAAQEAAAAPARGPATAPPGLGPSGLRSVLAVDDNPDVLTVLRLVFGRYKIELVTAPDASRALKTWHEAEGRFDLLITDVVMPNGPTGIELARTLRQFNPDLKVILMTGYSADLFKPDSLVMPGKPPHVLLKPFDLAGAVQAVASV